MRELRVPHVIKEALRRGATLCLSLSGGKDSEAMVKAVTPWFRAAGFTGNLFVCHADLGRAEWPQTMAHVQRICDELELPLVIARRTNGDLVARFEQRIESTRESGAPFWPSATNRYCTSHLKSGPIDTELRKPPPPFWPSSSNRYCTSDLKRGPIDTSIRNESTASIVISAEGVRADESREREKKPFIEVREGITSGSVRPEKNLKAMTPAQALIAMQPGQRLGLNWRPIHHWNTDDVWRACGTSTGDLKRRQMLHKAGNEELALAGWPSHPAYVWGNDRLSCALCVLANKNDLANGANHNPEIYRTYLELEMRGGATFRHGFSLFDLDVTGEAARIRDELGGASNDHSTTACQMRIPGLD